MCMIHGHELRGGMPGEGDAGLRGIKQRKNVTTVIA